MNTTKLKSFAVEARNILKRGVMNRVLALGFDQRGGVVEEPVSIQGGAVFMGETQSEDFYHKWLALHQRIEAKGLREVQEEAAYTWFNRLMAIRIMQMNRLIDPVLDYRSDSVRLPILLTDAMRGAIPAMPDDDRERLMRLLNDPRRTAEQFAMLITAFCHNTPVINRCFGGIADYTELLLPRDILEENGFIDMLNHTDFISGEDYKTPELIGWLYQFYISERKDEVFAKKGKYDPDEIPAATQIFTPNWIVKYMVQNTVGRIYLDNNPYEDELKAQWRYLVDNENQGEKLVVNDLKEMKVADLACGSGHILNECFDLLLDLYVNEGYSRRDAIESIFANNLTGIDIDTRAKQLATFALLLKACQRDASFTDAHAMPHVLDMPRPFSETMSEWLHGATDKESIRMAARGAIHHYLKGATDAAKQQFADAVRLMENADSLGSIMKFDISPETRKALNECTAEYEQVLAEDPEAVPLMIQKTMPYVYVILALTEKYHAIVLNPPYMGSGAMGDVLSKYIKDNYEDGKADFCTVFMLMQAERTITGGFYGFITPPSWMFLSTFENLRRNIIDTQSICSLLHLSRGIFGADFGSVSAVIKNQQTKNAKGTYFRLIERTFQEFFEADLRKLFEYTLENHEFKYDFGVYNKDSREIYSSPDGKRIYYPDIQQANFEKIPGSPIGYWVSEKAIEVVSQSDSIKDLASPRQGFATGDNNRFLRYIWEVSASKVGKTKWVPCSKGGAFRKWFGNIYYSVNWENEGSEMKLFKGSVIRNESYYFQANGCTWSTISSGKPAFRLFEKEWLFESKGSVCFPINQDNLILLLGYFNSPVVYFYLSLYTPTMDYHEGPVGRLPFSISNIPKSINKVTECVEISRNDWDAHETSWDFKGNELVDMTADKYIDIMHDYGDWIGAMVDLAPPQLDSLEWRVGVFHTRWETMFERLHANEEELNRQFIDIYGLQDELTPDVPLDEVTILQQGEISIEEGEIVWHDDVLIKQLISYAVGCWMGRYRLDKPGLHIAHTDATQEEIAPYDYNGEPFYIDDDGIIPLMPRDSMFSDNAAHRIADFVRQVFGAESQVTNLNFMEAALGKSLEQYFIKDFWKDHKKMYQNRPIYWLFSSKKGAFQCLAYMHRMDAYTVERVRQKYLLPHMDDLRHRIADMEQRAAELNSTERRTLDTMKKQLDECMEYHERLHPVADRQIAFDLDDGVVVNHAKFGDILAKLK